MSPWLEIIVFLVMLVGLVGLVVPLFPGIFIIWLSGLVYGLLQGFTLSGGVLFSLISLLMIAGEVLDNLVVGASARKAGVPWLTIGLAFAAGVIGTLIFPPLGGLIAVPLVGVGLEYRRLRNWRAAFSVLKSLVLGWSLAFLLRLGIGVGMMVCWAIWAWQNSAA